MTEHEVKEWLKRAYNAYKETELLKMLLTASRMHAEGLDRSGEYNYPGKSDTRLNGTETAFLRVADIERKYNEQKRELENISGEISKAIALLHDNELEVILIHRYLLFHTIEQIAEIMHYSVRSVQYKHKKAIEKLCTLLHCVER